MGEDEGGRRLREPLARRGVDKIETVWFPLSFIPSHRGEGRVLEDISEKVRDKFSDIIV